MLFKFLIVMGINYFWVFLFFINGVYYVYYIVRVSSIFCNVLFDMVVES